MVKEIWKIIPNTNELWEISNLGNIRNTKDICFKFQNDIPRHTIKNKIYEKRLGYNIASLWIGEKTNKRINVPKNVMALFGGYEESSLRRGKIKYKNGIHDDNIENLEFVKTINHNKRAKTKKEMKTICCENDLKYIGLDYGCDNKGKILFICNKHKNKGIQQSSISHMKTKKIKCCYCSGKIVTKHDLKNDPKIHKNVYILGEYKNAHTPIKCICLVCGNIFDMSPNSLKSGHACPKCSAKRVAQKNKLSKYDIEYRVKKNNPNILITKFGDDVECLCLIHKKYFNLKIKTLLANDGGCPYCNRSSGENAILLWLVENKIDYTREKTFDNLHHRRPLRFDFYLPKLNICIEFQGEQHYYPVKFSKNQNPYEKLLYTQKCDKLKRDYCKRNNITLIEIPYWEKDNIPNILNKLNKNV